jgi:hypothetical protein
MSLVNDARDVKHVSIAQGADGVTDLVAAVAGQRIYVVRFVITLDAAGTLQFTSGTGPTAESGLMAFAANGGLVVMGDPNSPALKVAALGDKLSISTVTGKAAGWLEYLLDSK